MVTPTPLNFEWYLKNHLGSTMLVYGTQSSVNIQQTDVGDKIAAYDYRSFGEMVELTPPPTGKVTENFTGKEHDDEIALDYFGARYLDPMLGMWVSVDPARQFASPYLYAGNGYNPVNGVDPDGKYYIYKVADKELAKSIGEYQFQYAALVEFLFFKAYDWFVPGGSSNLTFKKPDDEIENSLRPDKDAAVFNAVLDILKFYSWMKSVKCLSEADKIMEKVNYGNSLYSIASIKDNPWFEDYMRNLTRLRGISGSSVEDVKSKAAWANSYGWKLYKDKVNITKDIQRAYAEAYYNKFEKHKYE